MINKKIVFTIVASNYVGLALVLRESFFKYHDFNNYEFFIIVADGTENIPNFNNDNIQILDATKIVKDKYNQHVLDDISFKYDITEYCTCIKPIIFNYFLESYDKAIYLDPDILLFDNLTFVFDYLDDYSAVTTPHIIYPSNLEGPRSDLGILNTGVFNFGFVAFNSSALAISYLKFWEDRLLKYCFIDVYQGMFDDQIWGCFLPSFMGDSLKVLLHPGCNLAPWNFHERKIMSINHSYKVIQRENSLYNDSQEYPLIFVHYSGYNYKALLDGKVEQNNLESVNFDDIDVITSIYKNTLLKNKELIHKFLDTPYQFNYYSNGRTITLFQRRLYSSCKEIYFTEPFKSSGDFYKKLKRNKLFEKRENNKINLSSIKNKNQKLKIIFIIFSLIKKIIGIDNYLMIIKFMRMFGDFKKQDFLLRK